MEVNYRTIRTFLIALLVVTIFRLITALIFFAPPNGEDNFKNQEFDGYNRTGGHNDEYNQYRIMWHHEIAAIIIINICSFLLMHALMAKHTQLERQYYDQNTHLKRPVGYTPALLSLFAIFVESVISLAFLATFLNRTNRSANHGTYPNLFRDIYALMAADAFLILVTLAAMALIRQILYKVSMTTLFKNLILAGLIFRLITAVIFFSPPNGENNFNEDQRNCYQANPQNGECSQWNRTYWHELAAIIIINLAGILLWCTLTGRQAVLLGHKAKREYDQVPANSQRPNGAVVNEPYIAQQPAHGIQMRNNNI